MKKYGNEFKAGIFILACIAGFAYMTYSTGKLNIKKEGYSIYVLFSEAAGLKNKSPVMLNGCEVGKVEDIQFSYDLDQTRLKLKLWIDKSARIRENPVISIKTLGLMGEKYIQISSSQGKSFIEPGTVLLGRPYLDLDALLEQAQSISKDLNTQISSLITNLNSNIDGNEGNVSAMIRNLEATSENFEEFSADLKRHPWKLLFKGKETPERRK